MQNRRDQLQAYRFQNRRALAALVTGEPNLLDPPMRRLTVTTIAGVMIAVLVTVGFTVFGLIRPKAGDSWKTAGAIIVETDTGATYIYRNDTLYSVVNYTSGVLVLGGTKKVETIEVTRDDLEGAKHGPQIGIPNLPSTLPPADELVTTGFAACSRQREVADNQVGVRVSVEVGDELKTAAVPADDGVLVTTGDRQNFLLYDGRRFAVSDARTITALGLADQPPLQVGTAFVDTIPQGSNLSAPRIPGAGTHVTLNGISAVVGQLVVATGGRTYVAMPDGLGPVNDVQRALLETLPIGPGGSLLDPVSTSQSKALAPGPSAQWTSIVDSQLDGLPAAVPKIDTDAAGNGGVCARFRSGSQQPTFAVPPSVLPSYQAQNVQQTATSLAGTADSVNLPSGQAALVATLGGSGVYLIGDPGQKFAAVGAVLGGFGYDAGKATKLPSALLKLIPAGPALSRDDAVRSIGN